MTQITLQNVHVDLPVYTSRSRGLINELFRFAPRERARVEAAGLFAYQVHALRGIDITIRDGDRVGLVGPNGAGKTTLLRVLSGAYEPRAGDVSIQGSVGSLTDLALGMDMEANGYENIHMRGLYLKKSRTEIKALTEDIESFTGLGPHLALPVRTYSSGMKLRLAFALSTAVIPETLLMDEIIGAGDAQFRDKAKARLDAMVSGVRILVLASHSDAIIRRFCSRALYMRDGRVVLDGPVDDCLSLYNAECKAALA